MLRLMDLAQGEYIKFLFDDDILHPFCVQLLLQSLEETRAQNTTLAFSPRDVIDTDNNILHTINLLGLSGTARTTIDGSQCIALAAQNCVNFVGEMTTIMFRKEDCFDAAGRNTLMDLAGVPLKGLGDVGALINLASKGNVVAHPMSLSYFRQHADSNSNPATNREFIYAITDWEDVIDHAVLGGYLNQAQSVQAYESLLKIYLHWAPTYVELATDMKRAMSKMKAAA